MCRRKLETSSFLALLAALSFAALSCASSVGDPCTSNRECAFGQECDTAPPGGYCFIQPCRPNSCPEEASCATFYFGDRARTYCLKRCSSNGDCRDGYRCRFDVGAAGGVCYVGTRADGGA